MHFTKMQGLGNDYLYVYGNVPEKIKEICVRLSERHFGAGSDGMIFISPSSVADFKMRIFNADGSEAKMCGNGIRCVGKYVYEKGYTEKTNLRIETLSGIKTLNLRLIAGKVKQVSVDMGRAEVSKDITVPLENGEIICTPVSVGNPHAVIFVKNAENSAVSTIGPQMEHSELFPGGVNTEFAEVIGDNIIRMRVWERGSGITLACGTGACAVVSAAVSKGLCEFDQPITVKLDGGTLEIAVNHKYKITMTGPAETVYEGETKC
ncbi:MAG: diaminopimelate epimerase [Clostridia bacterium]|nr:diaminopimelate epimerase [Clostridia bacterium]